MIAKGKYDQSSKADVCKRPKNFDERALLNDFENIHWKNAFNSTVDTNTICETFFTKSNEIINKHLPLKKLSKKEAKLLAKPWITPALRNSMKRRDRLLNRYIKEKDVVKKDEIHKKYKTLRNRILSLTRSSKKLHFQKIF